MLLQTEKEMVPWRRRGGGIDREHGNIYSCKENLEQLSHANMRFYDREKSLRSIIQFHASVDRKVNVLRSFSNVFG